MGSTLQNTPDGRPTRGHELRAVGLAFVTTLAAVCVIVLGWWVMLAINANLSPDPVRDARVAADEAARQETRRLAQLGPAGPALDLHAVARGQRLYSACIACHGPEARGVPNMGKDLVRGRFALKASDAALVAMIAAGRDASDPLNTTRVAMPARGGRAEYTDAHLSDIVVYLRSLQDPRRASGPLPEVTVAVLDEDPTPTPSPTTSPTTSSAAPTAVATTDPVLKSAATAPGTGLDADAIKRGQRVFSSCLACHGKGGVGIAKTGADLVHSDFIKNKTDDELLAFIKQGRQPSSPETRMGLSMPAKGGNPALKDNQIKDVIVYLRSLQQAAADAK